MKKNDCHGRIQKYGNFFSKYIASSIYEKIHSPPYCCALLPYPGLFSLSKKKAVNCVSVK